MKEIQLKKLLVAQIKHSSLSTLVAMATLLINTSSVLAETIYRTREITHFELVNGRASWQTTAIQRIAGSIWEFYDDGTFIYRRPDNYPLVGTYGCGNRECSTYVFEANGSTNQGVGGTYSNITGTMIIGSDGYPVVNIRLTAFVATSGMSINNQQLPPWCNDSEYRAIAILE